MTDLFFGLKQNSLTAQTFQDGVLIEQQKASQNGVAPDAGRFKIFAIDSADSGKNAGFVDRTWVDQGEGIGIADGGDGNTNARKRIDGDEALGVSFGGFQAKTAEILLDRVSSADGAQVRVRAFRDGVEVDSLVMTLSGDGRQPVNFSSLFSFDEIQISAADADTQFTFRSINLKEATAEVLSFRQKPNTTAVQVLQDGVVIEQATASQNQAVPNVAPFTLSAVNSADAGRNAGFVDRTYFDQGEGTGIVDGDDGNSSTRKRIEGDEILGISFGNYLTTDALINVDRINSIDGAAVKVEAFRGGISVDSEIFTLGSGSLLGDRTFDFGSTSLFDTLKISAADADTQFTFRGVDLPGAFAV
jgi:hypothetical protein